MIGDSNDGPIANDRTPDVLFDLDGDGHSDLHLFAAGDEFNVISYVQAAPGSDLSFTGLPLVRGSQVDASQTFSLSSLSMSAHQSFTQPQTDTPGGTLAGNYGFRFTSGGATHYGWADVSVTAEFNTFGSLEAAYVLQWGYESDPNTPITVGVIPEPASAATLLVAAPTLCLRLRR